MPHFPETTSFSLLDGPLLHSTKPPPTLPLLSILLNRSWRRRPLPLPRQPINHTRSRLLPPHLRRYTLLQPRQQTPAHLPRLLRHQHIHDHQTRHGLNNRHRPRNHTRIMPALRLQHPTLVRVRTGLLRQGNGRGRFERDAKVNAVPIRDAALDAAGVIRRRREGLGAVGQCRRHKGVVVHGPRDQGAREAGADFEALGRGDREHGVRERGFEFVEDRLAETNGTVSDHTRDGAADAVVGVAVRFDEFLHARGDGGGGAARGDVCVDGFAGDGREEGEEVRVRGGGRVRGCRREEGLGADGGRKCYDLHGGCEGQVALCYASGCYSAWKLLVLGRDRSEDVCGLASRATRRVIKRTDCLPSTASSTSTARFDTVLLEIRKVSVTRAWIQIHRAPAVIFGPLILVLHNHGDGRAKRDAELGAGLDLHEIFFVAWCC